MQARNRSIPKWVITLCLMTAGPSGINAYVLPRHKEVTQNWVWLLIHKVREGLIDSNDGTLAAVVEVDKTWVAGKRKNKHSRKLHGLRGIQCPERCS